MHNIIFFIIYFFIFSLYLSGCSNAPISKQSKHALLIDDITLISPENETPVEHASVLILEDRIVEIGPASQVKGPAGAIVLSGKGKFLTPGLIDSHVHLGSIPGVNLDEPPHDKGLIDSYFEQLPRSYLYFGYTTLVDLAALKPEVLNKVRSRPLYPDLYDCGGSLPIANGYPMAFIPKAIRYKLIKNFIYDSAQAAAIPAQYLPEDHTPSAAVTRVKDSGGICVKTYLEKGFGKKMNFPVPSLATLQEIALAARKAGLVSLVHANSLEAQEQILHSGLDIIAHGMWKWGPYSQNTGLPTQVKNVLDQIIFKKIGYMPTIQVMAGYQALADPDFLNDPQLLNVLSKGLIDYYKTPQGKWFRKSIERDEASQLTLQVSEPPLSKVRRVTQYLAEKKANLIFGTDTPASPTYGNPPGYNGYLEMKNWIRSGVSLKQLLYSATLGNARALKLDNSIGTIEKGRIAHLLILQKDPYETVEAYDSIDTVIVRGQAISRNSLKAPN